MTTKTRLLLLTTSALASLGAAIALAGPLPQGGQVVGGGATISQGGNHTTVTQSTPNAIINWQSFDIANGYATQFIQPNASSVTLNRVTGGFGPSSIYGTLTANGRLFLVNPDGILIGSTGVINTGGFLATTHDIKNDDFMAGRYTFAIPGKPDASVVNLGSITATSGGFAALVAPGVRNAGTITANLGTVGLASSGQGFTLDLYGDKLITLAPGDTVANQVRDVATGQTLSALVQNDASGVLRANGGRVELTAATARTIVDSVINNTGVIEANSIGSRNGLIVLGASTAATKGDGAPTQTVKISGTLSAAGKKPGETGGKIQVTGESIAITGASIDASGTAGGGKVLIGGDTGGGKVNPAVQGNALAALESYSIGNATTVSVDGATRINASATDNGSGGKVVIWSDSVTSFAGAIVAQGGPNGGNGGFAEVSGKQHLGLSGAVDLSAAHGSFGTFLADPGTVNIQSGSALSQSGTDTFNDGYINQQLLTANFIIDTNGATGANGATGDINILSSAAIGWNTPTTLTLSALNNININSGATITSSGSGNLILRADNTGSGTGYVSPGAANQIDVSAGTGSVSIYYNPIGGYTFPTYPYNYASYVHTNSPSQLTSYMLVNSATDLANINNNLGGTYALGKSFSASSFAGFTSGTTFTGLLSGNGGLGTSYTISNLTLSSAQTMNSYGLFPFIGSTGIVRSLNLASVNVSAGANIQFIGALAGQNSGTIDNVHVLSGTVGGGSFTGIGAGGLVGQNYGAVIGSSSAATVSVGNAVDFSSINMAGGLVASNLGTISQSSATGAVSGGAYGFVGGLAAQNGLSGPNPGFGTIDSSFATGPVSSSGLYSSVGGLVGTQAPGSSILDSQGFGNVTANANGVGHFDAPTAGGLVGQNQGTIYSSNPSITLSSSCVQGAAYSCATGTVSVGARGTAGGLAGSNDGIIYSAFATGAVTGAAGAPPDPQTDNSTRLGGLVGNNNGLIALAFATGPVGTANTSYLTAGGLVGNNKGTIIYATATGQVLTGDYGMAGGLTGSNGQDNGYNCNGCTPGDGYLFNNTAIVSASTASGNVSVGALSFAGGLSGTGDGTFVLSTATGNVSGGHDSVLGGLVGAMGIGNGPSLIAYSDASGAVTATGANSVVGGLVGANGGFIYDSFASGPVTGTSSTFLGGLVGINVGLIQDSSASATVTGTGSQDIAGGLVGLNFGAIDPSTSSGNVTAGSNSIVGGLVGANGAFSNFANGLLLPSSFPTGTVSSDSSATGSASGGAGSTVGAQVGVNYPTSGLPAYPQVVNGCNDALCTVLSTGLLTVPSSNTDNIAVDPQNVSPTQQTAFFTFTSQDPIQPPPLLVSLPPSTPPGSSQNPPSPPGSPPGANISPGPPPGQGIGRTPDEQRFSGVPALNENRFVHNEVLLQIDNSVPPAQVAAVARELGLSVIGSQTIGGRTIYRFSIGSQDLRAVIAALEKKQVVAAAGANYQYHVQEDGAPQEGDSAQYIVEKLKLGDVHRRARGDNVNIAVIDSEIDTSHPDLAGVVIDEFDALGGPRKAHPHGTGMAGAIAAHNKLIGVSPDVKILAIRAFGESAGSAEGTSYSIIRGIEWAIEKGARVINMSFAGPRDPMIERALKTAKDKGIVLVAAAGNAGPKSPPLYPGADPSVIAVTATDANDAGFSGANRGKYIALAAPGVDILVPGPDDTYQLTTGTSVASAHITGVVALLLERDPSLTPDMVRTVLVSSAKQLAKGKSEQFGAGLVDPETALDTLGRTGSTSR